MKSLTHSFSGKKYFFKFLVLSAIAVIFCVFGPFWLQDAIAILGILTFGILHGANDLKIIARKTSQSDQSDRMKSFGLYIGVVFLGILLFFYLPRFALLSFVLVSCYHFGEQHWSGRIKNSKLKPWIYFIYGALVFNLLFTLQYLPSAQVISQITSVVLPPHFFWIGLLLTSSGFVILLGGEKINSITVLMEIILLVVLALLFAYASLLFAFGFYFVVWHSIPSLNSQLKYIYGTTQQNAFLRYIKSALIYWLGALGGLFLFYYFIEVEEAYLVSIFFSFLAAITFPHAVVMGLMFHSEGADED
ncbi:MAG: Brp/Blh family beta-carotene 15,15'-dioxygenase [Flavobacteriaceae bacterium]